MAYSYVWVQGTSRDDPSLCCNCVEVLQAATNGLMRVRFVQTAGCQAVYWRRLACLLLVTCKLVGTNRRVTWFGLGWHVHGPAPTFYVGIGSTLNSCLSSLNQLAW
jgi:hypothetical protein